MVRIRRISTDDPLYPQECDLRKSVLLGPVGIDLAGFKAEFPGAEERFEHYVALIDHPSGPRVVGCALLLPDYPEAGMGKLMQMAVDPQRQGEGIGKLLVVTIESRALGELGFQELFCHAREDARGFYERLGWTADSDRFLEVGIPHFRMTLRPPSSPEADDDFSGT